MCHIYIYMYIYSSSSFYACAPVRMYIHYLETYKECGVHVNAWREFETFGILAVHGLAEVQMNCYVVVGCTA
jgi:hypothetical protein